MSKLTFSNTGVTTGQPVLASQVSQSFDAFTGAGDYAITISGSLTAADNSKVTLEGDLILTDNVSAISQSNFTASAGGGGNVILKYNEGTKLATDSNGVTLTGAVTASGGVVTNDKIVVLGGGMTVTGDTSFANNITTGGSASFGTGLTVSGSTFLGDQGSNRISITGSLEINDPGSAAGASVSMSIDNDEFKMIQGADGTMLIGTPQLVIKGSDQAEQVAVFNQDSDVRLFFNNTRRFATTNEGAYISGSATTTGLEVHDGTNTAVRSATQTRFNFAGDTYLSNDSTDPSARVSFALGGATAANKKVAVSASNELHVYSGSINLQSGITQPTGSYLSAGNLNSVSVAGSNGIQKASFIIKNKEIDETEEQIFTWFPWQGLYPIPALSTSTNCSAQIKVELVLMERGANLNTPATKIGQIVAYSVFGLEGSGYNVGENPSGSVSLINQTTQIGDNIDVDFSVNSGGAASSFIRVLLDADGTGFPTGGLQVGGTAEITVVQGLA
tara:strand:+ start:209 stop:1717 length:1509 start_codon:yes stop_codon:yes gene_type:complete